jgi:hypothetical protein
MMAVSLTNDGPVTVLFDSRDRKPGTGSVPGSGTSTPTGQAKPRALTKEEQEVRANEKNAARASKKAEYERRLAAGLIPGRGKKATEGEGQEKAEEKDQEK